MRASVIVRTKDEASRLRLTLGSLSRQSETAEIVVVNDGSSDDTGAVLDGLAPIVRIDHPRPLGRSAASNAGAARASGDILLFLDGDTLAAPDFVARHLEAHRSRPGLIARGETYHLRGTRFLADPDAGTPQPGEEARVARMSAEELGRARVRLEDVLDRFPVVAERGRPGIYPGAGPRELYELEMAALRANPDCGVLWAAASGSNQSVSRAAFRAVGGFNAALSLNEHRELALRLCRAGCVMGAVRARTYHMTHRSQWRDPLDDDQWEAVFYRAHPLPEVALLPVLWASLADAPPFPPDLRITSLPALEAAARRLMAVDGSARAVRQAYFAACPAALP